MTASRRVLWRLLALALVSALASGACGGSDGDQTLTVVAAASLTDVMSDLGQAFEIANSGVAVRVSTGPSSGLRESILAGAPADVFASADRSNMDPVVAAGEASAPEVFTRNSLAIAVPPGNPASITGLDDFARDDLFLGLCASQVPCGSLAREALSAAGVEPALDTEASDVRSLLTQVASGDLDAGIVYRTDVRAAAGAVDGVDIPSEADVIAEYSIAVLASSSDPVRAGAFVAFVQSRRGQEILLAAGFGAP